MIELLQTQLDAMRRGNPLTVGMNALAFAAASLALLRDLENRIATLERINKSREHFERAVM